MAKIKICGLRRSEDIEYVNELSPDYIGFILSGGFRRSVSAAQAEKMKSFLKKNIKAVGVFVDEPIENINLDFIDLVQLHGNESPEYCSRINAPVIKALKPCDFNRISSYEPYVDYFMFDSGTGSGNIFDWSAIPKTDKRFFLAGGLNCGNLEDAIKKVNPFAVDISSSVETNGVKDYKKIKEVIKIVRGAANE